MDSMATTSHELAIEIGGITIVVRTDSGEFARLLADRYGPFVTAMGRVAAESSDGRSMGEPKTRQRIEVGKGPPYDRGGAASSFQLDVELLPPGLMSDAEDARVRLDGGRWVMERGDFRAEWNPEHRRGWVRQTPNPYSIDAVLRILHSLILAGEGGFLVHAASAIRNGRAFLFARRFLSPHWTLRLAFAASSGHRPHLLLDSFRAPE